MVRTGNSATTREHPERHSESSPASAPGRTKSAAIDKAGERGVNSGLTDPDEGAVATLQAPPGWTTSIPAQQSKALHHITVSQDNKSCDMHFAHLISGELAPNF